MKVRTRAELKDIAIQNPAEMRNVFAGKENSRVLVLCAYSRIRFPEMCLI